MTSTESDKYPCAKHDVVYQENILQEYSIASISEDGIIRLGADVSTLDIIHTDLWCHDCQTSVAISDIVPATDWQIY